MPDNPDFQHITDRDILAILEIAYEAPIDGCPSLTNAHEVSRGLDTVRASLARGYRETADKWEVVERHRAEEAERKRKAAERKAARAATGPLKWRPIQDVPRAQLQSGQPVWVAHVDSVYPGVFRPGGVAEPGWSFWVPDLDLHLYPHSGGLKGWALRVPPVFPGVP